MGITPPPHPAAAPSYAPLHRLGELRDRSYEDQQGRASGLKQLTPWGNGAEDANWSADGKKLVFDACPDLGSHGEVFTIDADGQQLTKLTDNDRSGGGSSDPVWFLDGTKILLLSMHFFSGESGITLSTMNPDDTDLHFISSNPGTEELHQPALESVP